MIRLFAAIPVPDEISGGLYRLRRPMPGVRWTEQSDYHLTLCFAGDIDNRQASEFADELSRIEMKPFPLRISSLDIFGGNDPHVLWAGLAPSTELDDLHRLVKGAARAAGLKPDNKPFKAHITLARLRSPPAGSIERFLRQNMALRSSEFTVDHFALYSAKPRTGGGPYVIEERFPLLPGLFLEDEYDYSQ
ncbi:MAG: RNA 2',3'-cyclic phosphodiesterase [Pseudomonadota bacterium]